MTDNITRSDKVETGQPEIFGWGICSIDKIQGNLIGIW